MRLDVHVGAGRHHPVHAKIEGGAPEEWERRQRKERPDPSMG